MQLRPGDGQRVHAPCPLVPGLVLAIFEIVAQARVARRMVHVLRVDRPVFGKERIAIGVLERDTRKMRARLHCQPRRAAQRAHDTRCLVGMLTARHHNRG